MNKIKVLSANIYNKIAAGEVVERPSSVIKELVENSIDAGSKNIVIEILEGGIESIKIIDDGIGIGKEDIRTAFLNHATSKINSIEDVYQIKTLGFRGEALSSIASISKMKLKSITDKDENGCEISLHGGDEIYFGETAIDKGTQIEVNSLFYNVPARLKFLKTPKKEATLITDLVTKLALSNPKVGFSFFSNGKKILETYANGNLESSVKTIYGKSVFENLISLNYTRERGVLSGYIGNLELCKNNRNYQNLFVNGRSIKSKTVIAAVDAAYKSFLTVNKHPLYVLFLEVDERSVDVNIHPRKSEVKFEFEREIFSIFFNGVHNSLKEYLEGKFHIPIEKKEDVSIKFEPLSYFDLNDEDKSSMKTLNENLNRNENKLDVLDLFKEKNESSSFLKDNETKEKDDFVKNILYGEKITQIPDVEVDIEEFEQIEKQYNIINQENKENIKEEIITNENEIMSKEKNDNRQYVKNEESINENKKVKKRKFRDLRYIGQFASTYIVAEEPINQELYIIDQHAAHEKVLFEEYYEKIKCGITARQMMLIPEIIHLTPRDFLVYNENKEIFEKSGYKIYDFGDNSIRICEIPYILGKVDIRSLFNQILESLDSVDVKKVEDLKYDRIASFSCKHAVKANRQLQPIEVDLLIDRLKYIENPFTCPHGRPSMVKISKTEMEKMFKRIQ